MTCLKKHGKSRHHPAATAWEGPSGQAKTKKTNHKGLLRNHEGLCIKEEVPSRKKLGKGILQEPVEFKFVSFIRMVHIWNRM
jgi:hypothetical protein